MLIIIMHHFCVHGVMMVSAHPPYPMTVANLDWQLLLTQLVGWGGNMANGIFMIITGYFMISRAMKYKKIFILTITMFFYAWLFDIIFGITGITPMKWTIYVTSLIPVWFGTNWFVSCYILFSFFIPFINPFLNSLSQKKYWQLLVLLFFVYTIMPTFLGSNFLKEAQLVYFLFMYAIGGFIQLHLFKIEKFHSHILWKKCLISCIGILLFTIVSFDLLGILSSKDIFVKQAWRFVNIFSVGISATMFLYFSTMPKFYSAKINRIATSILGIYLIHENPFIRKLIWTQILPNQMFLNSNLFPILLIGKVIAVFIICLFIDQLRVYFIRPLYQSWVNKHWDWFCQKGHLLTEKVKY